MGHADTTDLTTVQAMLDADRKHLLNRLLNDIEHQGWTEHTASGNEEHSILLALIGQLTQEIEDLRNQLELVQLRHNPLPDSPATAAGRDRATQRPSSRR
ncbi:MAG: hypothetical protein SVU32_01275 [Candidatus Nanohaloarchaea archaeon]|nr:hypothetical protein [Candidatus Nanohaloarchaea archaeon]